METISVPSAIAWSVLLLPLIAVPLVILRKKGCTAEINVIWYAFSLIFLAWWFLHLAMAWGFIELPWVDAEPNRATPSPTPAPWTGRYFYAMAHEYLTNTKAELALVAAVIVLAVAPQLLNYVLSGLSGCATTPPLVWQFEKIAIWSLIKFLAAFGGVFVAEGLGVYGTPDQDLSSRAIMDHAENLLRGLTAVGLAFVVTVLQVYTLEAASALGKAWQQKPESWPYRLHRFFTRNLPKDEATNDASADFNGRELWDKLTPSQQQEIGALVVRSARSGLPREQSSSKAGSSPSSKAPPE